MKNWFKKYVLDVARNSEDECTRIILFGLYIDFRNWFVDEKDSDGFEGVWLTQEQVTEILKDEERRNSKRKNKISGTKFIKIPWYRTILEWSKFQYKLRIAFSILIGSLLGFLVGSFT